MSIQLREQRKEDLEQHLAEFNAELRKQNPEMVAADAGEKGEGDDEVEWGGIDGKASEPIEDVEREDEYVDEDKYTTVTVEAMGEDAEVESELRATEKAITKDRDDAKTSKKRAWKTADGKAKPKKKKFRYESKAERQVTRQKQKKSSQAAKARRENKP